MQFDQVSIPLHYNFAKCQFSFGHNKNSQEWNGNVMILIFIVTFPLFQLPLPNLQTPPTDQKPEGGNGE